MRPAIRGSPDICIDIARGVKQGCPLSPLPFVICYDVLIQQIDDIDDIDSISPHACADDLAIAATRLFEL